MNGSERPKFPLNQMHCTGCGKDFPDDGTPHKHSIFHDAFPILVPILIAITIIGFIWVGVIKN